MKLLTKFTLLIITLIFFSCTPEKNQFVEINGKVVNTDTKSILLVKPNQDLRHDSLIEIPIIDGKFHYKSKIKNAEVFDLFLGKAKKIGGGRFMPLFLENAKITLTIYPENNFDENIVKGGKLNTEYLKYKKDFDNKFNYKIKPLKDSIGVLFKRGEYNSDKMDAVLSKLKNAQNQDEKMTLYKKIETLQKSNQHLSPKAKILNDKLKIIYKEQEKFQHEYIEKNPTIVSYSFLLKNLIFKNGDVDISFTKTNYEKLSKANPNHPYNELVLNLIKAIEDVKVGKKYIDFTAPNLNGNLIKLSDKIDGKVAILDLWATWCGPCIGKSRSIVPLYNEFKDKGFTVVGVAGEFKNTDRLVKFLKKEKLPWINLVELDRENKIWQKYNVDGSGGGVFLIDENGIIIAKDPTAKEIRMELESRLN